VKDLFWGAVPVLILIAAAWHWLGRDLTVAGLAVIVLIAATASRTLFSKQQWRRMKWKTILRLRPNIGFASLPEVWFRWGRVGALHYGRRARPSMRLGRRLFARTTQYAHRLGRAQYFRRVYVSLEHQVLRLAPPRKGKTGWLSDRVMEHRGACIVHETRPDTFFATAGHRARLGPVQTFNPDLLGDIPSTFRWAMTAGCDDPREAFYRAADLVGAVANHGEMQWWSEKARGVLAAAVHAAGLPSDQDVLAAQAIGAGLQAATLAGADMSAVWDWAYGDNTLITSVQGHPGASANLFGALTELNRPGKTADSIRITMSKSLEWLAIPELRDMVTGPDARPFSVPRFLDTCGTIYLISPGDEESPSAPLFRCFAGYLHRGAKRHALLQPGRRLDPGVLFALDELHKCPVNLPSWLADSAGFGIQIDAVVHSTGQLIEKYGPEGLNTVWSTTGVKVFLGGIHDADTLKKVSLLGGTTPGGEAGENPCIPVEYLARLPRWRALIINDDLCPVVVKFRPVWRRTRHRLGLRARPPHLAAPRRAVPVLLDDTAPLPWPHGPAAPEPALPEMNGDLTT
jgi:Type IV secretory system Conjugative DNA transfer